MGRALVRYFGGKHVLAPWIVGHLPPHRVYVEPFGGGASVLLRKRRSEVEVLCDLDPRLVSLYRVVAHPTLSVDLAWRVWLAKYRRQTLENLTIRPEADDDLGRAIEIVVRGGLGMSTSDRAGFRGLRARPDGTTMEADWYNYRKSIPEFRRRLEDVVIHQRDALDVMLEYDSLDTLHYVDPPYVPATRAKNGHGYRHELGLSDHVRLVEFLSSLRGKVVLSGYPHPIYDQGLVGWQRRDRHALDNGRQRRTECLWLNPAAVKQLDIFAA